VRVASRHAPDHLAERICAAAASANARRVAMEVVWAATSPDDGRFSPHEVVTTVEQLERRFIELRARGEGYLEVRLPDRDFPVLTMGFRGDHAVIHAAESRESIALQQSASAHRGAASVRGSGVERAVGAGQRPAGGQLAVPPLGRSSGSPAQLREHRVARARELRI